MDCASQGEARGENRQPKCQALEKTNQARIESIVGALRRHMGIVVSDEKLSSSLRCCPLNQTACRNLLQVCPRSLHAQLSSLPTATAAAAPSLTAAIRTLQPRLAHPCADARQAWQPFAHLHNSRRLGLLSSGLLRGGRRLGGCPGGGARGVQGAGALGGCGLAGVASLQVRQQALAVEIQEYKARSAMSMARGRSRSAGCG